MLRLAAALFQNDLSLLLFEIDLPSGHIKFMIWHWIIRSRLIIVQVLACQPRPILWQSALRVSYIFVVRVMLRIFNTLLTIWFRVEGCGAILDDCCPETLVFHRGKFDWLQSALPVPNEVLAASITGWSLLKRIVLNYPHLARVPAIANQWSLYSLMPHRSEFGVWAIFRHRFVVVVQLPPRSVWLHLCLLWEHAQVRANWTRPASLPLSRLFLFDLLLWEFTVQSALHRQVNRGNDSRMVLVADLIMVREGTFAL